VKFLRRSFLWQSAGWLASLSLFAKAQHGAVGLSGLAPDLNALISTVLPSFWGQKWSDRKSAEFLKWLGSYRAVAETEHGYGVTKIAFTPASPEAGYVKDMQALKAQALEQHQKSFTAISPVQRRALVAAALTQAKVAKLPHAPDGAHLASDILAWFYSKSEASDLCYERSIQSFGCRGWSGAGSEPKPLKMGEA
jgi:hypothetical protein